MTIELIFRNLPALFCSLFIAVLFVQSGLDKVLDWKGNLAFLKEHFAKSPLAPTVTLMTAVITVMEIATGVLAAAGLIAFFATGSVLVMFYASIVGAATLTALFFGQRVAKDYPGSAVLVPYFLLVIVLMLLTKPV